MISQQESRVTQQESSLSSRAQAAYASLANGRPVPRFELQALAEVESDFTITQGDQEGIFRFGNHFMELGSGSHVRVRAKTSEKEHDLILLKTDPAGRPLFRIHCIAELIEDPA